jgi:hypothetical protein
VTINAWPGTIATAGVREEFAHSDIENYEAVAKDIPAHRSAKRQKLRASAHSSVRPRALHQQRLDHRRRRPLHGQLDAELDPEVDGEARNKHEDGTRPRGQVKRQWFAAPIQRRPFVMSG